MSTSADVATTPFEAPAGLAGVSVARTQVSDVLGRQGFYHYRGYNAVDIARRGRVEDAWHLLLRGDLVKLLGHALFQARHAFGEYRLTFAGQILLGVDPIEQIAGIEAAEAATATAGQRA